ncbi:MAG: hypothetical protein ACYC92_02225 [Candidatus Acidiferrales bacterium]
MASKQKLTFESFHEVWGTGVDGFVIEQAATFGGRDIKFKGIIPRSTLLGQNDVESFMKFWIKQEGMNGRLDCFLKSPEALGNCFDLGTLTAGQYIDDFFRAKEAKPWH